MQSTLLHPSRMTRQMMDQTKNYMDTELARYGWVINRIGIGLAVFLGYNLRFEALC